MLLNQDCTEDIKVEDLSLFVPSPHLRGAHIGALQAKQFPLQAGLWRWQGGAEDCEAAKRWGEA